MSAATAIVFMRAAPSYWCSVYPRVRREVGQQRGRAASIPDSDLRRTALHALGAKRANIDGAAAFAAFVPRAQRGAVVRAQVAFQALYDYLDTLTEQPHPDPVANSRRLHGALTSALDPSAGGGDYRAHRAVIEDGGYLHGTVERCQAALSALPGYEAVRPSAARLGDYIVEYQSLNLPWGMGNEAEEKNGGAQAPHEMLERWAAQRTPPESGLAWWETAASAGSSLGLFALIAMAAQPRASAADALAVENAYFPWIGALHSLLDSLIDLEEDRASGQPALIEHYGGPEETAAGLRGLARECRRRAASLPQAERHLTILASMAGLYLAEREARRPHAIQARRGVLDALGALTAPAMALARLRRLVGR